MGTVFNIRGTNGSGKTTVARAFLPPRPYGKSVFLHGPVELFYERSMARREEGAKPSDLAEMTRSTRQFIIILIILACIYAGFTFSGDDW